MLMTALISEILASAGLKHEISVQAPITVEFNAEQDAADALYLHLGNQTVPAYHPGKGLDRSIDAIIAVHDIKLTLSRSVNENQIVCSAGQVRLEQADGSTTLILPPLNDYMLVRVLPACK